MTAFDQLIPRLAAAEVEFIIVDGVAATLHGASRLTRDLDSVYRRTDENFRKLSAALRPLKPYLRGAPPLLPFILDQATLRRGLNFTLTTDLGALDLLGEIVGGGYEELLPFSLEIELFGSAVRYLSLEALLRAKRAAGRQQDLEVVAELEALHEELLRGEHEGADGAIPRDG